MAGKPRTARQRAALKKAQTVSAAKRRMAGTRINKKLSSARPGFDGPLEEAQQIAGNRAFSGKVAKAKKKQSPAYKTYKRG